MLDSNDFMVQVPIVNLSLAQIAFLKEKELSQVEPSFTFHLQMALE